MLVGFVGVGEYLQLMYAAWRIKGEVRWDGIGSLKWLTLSIKKRPPRKLSVFLSSLLSPFLPTWQTHTSLTPNYIYLFITRNYIVFNSLNQFTYIYASSYVRGKNYWGWKPGCVSFPQEMMEEMMREGIC